jgi:hypothetical protein
MNRDERDAEKEDTTSTDLANELAGNSLPAEILSGETPTLDVQAAVDLAVSRATQNLRQWDEKILRAACSAARPAVERDLRQQGRVFTKDDVRPLVKMRVRAYAEKYGVTLPSSPTLGSTALEAAAGDLCGALSLPWTSFMPPQIQMVAKAAEAGNPRARSWLKKLFGKNKSAEAPKTQASPPPAAPPPAAQAPTKSPEEQHEGSDGDDVGRRPFIHHRHHRHHRRRDDQQYQQSQLTPQGQPYSQYQQTPYGQYQQTPYGQPYNPALAAASSTYAQAHAPATPTYPTSYPTSYNPYLAPYGQQPYNPNLPASSTNVPPAATDYLIEGAEDPVGSSDSLGAFLHKLNPLYWLKSSEERKFIDAERQAWIDNAALQKRLAKKGEVAEAGEKALAAKQAVLAAQARSAELETQLKSIETQLAGARVGRAELVGADLATDVPEPEAAPVLAKISKARKLNAANAAELEPICDKMRRGAPLSPEETGKVLVLLARNEQLHEFRKKLVSGELYAKSSSAGTIERNVVLGAVKVMTPTEQAMMSRMVALAKQGNPNAQRALTLLKAQGYAVTMGSTSPAPLARVPGQPLTIAEQQKLAKIVGLAKQGNPNALAALTKLREQGYAVTMGRGDFVGWGVSDAFSLAMKPITVPAKYLWKGTKAVGRALGITHGGQSAEQARLARLQAAQQRARAAQARARMADAQSEAEYRAQQQLAAAADAEAEAADAEATAREAAMQTAEAQFLPGQTETEAESAQAADASGASMPTITPLPPSPSPQDAELERLMAASHKKLKAERRAVVAKKNPRAAKILAKSEQKSPAGMKLQASMELYRRAEKRGSKERRAVASMVARAKKGDPQALADVEALKAAGVAVKADRKAGKHVERVYASRARAAKVKAARKKAEIAISDQLVRRSRARRLAKVAKVEARAARGDAKCQAIVKKHVARAKAGDARSKTVVSALVLAKHVRTSAPTKRERRNLKQAQKLVKRIGRGDRRALAQVRVIDAAAKHGNPNARRARKRLQTAAALELTLKTGTVVLPAAAATRAALSKRKKAKQAADRRKVATVEAKVRRGTATREEALAAANAAKEFGDHAKAGELAALSMSLPSAGEELRRTAAFAATTQAGNPKSLATAARAEEMAKEGDPRGVEAMGMLAGVKALDQVARGKDVDPAMKSAVRDVEAAQGGDAAAAEKIASMQARAAAKDPVAVKYVVYATGAAVVARALANKPQALEEWHEKAGIAPRSTENDDVQVVDAEVVSRGPSSLPDQPLPPVRGFFGLLGASLKAILLATRDPFQNHREGASSLGRRQPAGDEAGDELGETYMSSRKNLVLKQALATKTITPNNLDMLRDLETNPGETVEILRRAGVKVSSPSGPTDLRGNGTSTPPTHQERTSEWTARRQKAQTSREGEPTPTKEAAEWTARRQKAQTSTDASGDDRQKLVADTKARLEKIKSNAARGDKIAKQKWWNVTSNLMSYRDSAQKGDPKAKDMVAVLEATGLFDK